MRSILISEASYQAKGLLAWQEAAKLLLKQAKERRIWCFNGDLGAGKTTCIKALCAVLGVTEHVTSPTFGIVHEYPYGRGEQVYHFDCYRLKSLQEAIDIGCTHYFDSGSYCFIEWPAVVQPLLPTDCVTIAIQESPDGGRVIQYELK